MFNNIRPDGPYGEPTRYTKVELAPHPETKRQNHIAYKSNIEYCLSSQGNMYWSIEMFLGLSCGEYRATWNAKDITNDIVVDWLQRFDISDIDHEAIETIVVEIHADYNIFACAKKKYRKILAPVLLNWILNAKMENIKNNVERKSFTCDIPIASETVTQIQDILKQAKAEHKNLDFDRLMLHNGSPTIRIHDVTQPNIDSIHVWGIGREYSLKAIKEFINCLNHAISE